jgi:hypothetical protein
MPYLMPTPTRGRARTTFFTVAQSENANMIEAASVQRKEVSQASNFN